MAAFGQAAVESAVLTGESVGAATGAKGAASKPYVPPPIDASMVTVGLSRKDLFSRCGEPRMRSTGIRDSKLVETVWYTTADKDQLKVELEADAVTLVFSSRTARANQ
ncbi:MAG: hypothetical protein EXQ57_08235 [Bryobacterales bacterium]|nr:hypothetical protein [Bryobacterales bacterium]